MTPIRPDHRLALFMEGALDDSSGKMGFGVLRYSPNPIACVIDSRFAGQDAADVTRIPRSVPVVASVDEAIALGAQVLVLGIAPAGGLIPPEWYSALDRAVEGGLSLVNGLHDLLGPRYRQLIPGQFVWDIRLEPPGIGVGKGEARLLPNRRILMIGTDMSVGKMTAGLEIQKEARNRGIDTAFVATGQIGITITGRGVPLDAVRVDFASGAIEREVLAAGHAEWVIIEGQGSLLHPGSTATLPLMRGSCPTDLILCHRAGMKTLQRTNWVRIPDLREFTTLYEGLASAWGTYPRPRTAGIALITAGLSDDEAARAIAEVEAETGLSACDPVRDGAGKLVDALQSAAS